ncbi:hypothetical protein B5M47_03015 [candidate division CPR3 bacterium 4484_211]|uniref:Four helix bundle protein n=1 Tax=candidate division CPR3 bacterium 4484_211 TaxID=1968527 RepID=A0A1W9NXC3_UNCC3|nr:MAG: hypothetical protein B5M47_03015 [candidate division CPR3 bacterium 4484_211]
MFRLKDISAYQISSEASEAVWNIVNKWEILAKKTVGEQWIKAADSIAANIAEGFGRFHKKDKNKFYFNARASAFETAHWTKVAWKRNLITEAQYEGIIKKLRKLPREINTLIKLTRENLKK